SGNEEDVRAGRRPRGRALPASRRCSGERNWTPSGGTNRMALKDWISRGRSLPHRSPEPIDMSVVRQVAQRADALGFRDLWVTENTLDHVFSFDPVVILTYAAAVTTKIRVGVSVAVLPVQNQIHVPHH